MPGPSGPYTPPPPSGPVNPPPPGRPSLVEPESAATAARHARRCDGKWLGHDNWLALAHLAPNIIGI